MVSLFVVEAYERGYSGGGGSLLVNAQNFYSDLKELSIKSSAARAPECWT
jgi:hypothetical protein